MCPEKEAGDTIKTAIHDLGGRQTYNRKSRAYQLCPERDLEEVDAADYDALCLQGGRAPEYLRLNDRVIEMTRHFFAADKPVAAICHAAQTLAAADVLDGRRCSAYPACAPEVEAAGGTYVDVEMNEAVTDGNLVTAPAWPAHAAWIRQFLDVLGTRIEHAEPVTA